MRSLSLGLFLLVITACSGQGTAPAAAPNCNDVMPTTFAELMEEENTVLLDVRTPAETADGTIEGAREMDFRDPDFGQRVAELDKDKTYLVYCASGGRSGQTCRMMTAAGFERVYNLEGGYRAWRE